MYKTSYIKFSVRWNKIPSPDALGNFELLIDEEILAREDLGGGNDKSGHHRASHSSRWK